MSGEGRIHFGTLHPDGSVTDEREISQSAVRACPHLIMVPEHYRDDGSCRCSDPEHEAMKGWGYRWEDGQWRA